MIGTIESCCRREGTRDEANFLQLRDHHNILALLVGHMLEPIRNEPDTALGQLEGSGMDGGGNGHGANETQEGQGLCGPTPFAIEAAILSGPLIHPPPFADSGRLKGSCERVQSPSFDVKANAKIMNKEALTIVDFLVSATELGTKYMIGSGDNQLSLAQRPDGNGRVHPLFHWDRIPGKGYRLTPWVRLLMDSEVISVSQDDLPRSSAIIYASNFKS